MREKMEAMQPQIEEFVATLNEQLVSRTSPDEPSAEHSLIPVIEIPFPSPRKAPSRKSKKSK